MAPGHFATADSRPSASGEMNCPILTQVILASWALSISRKKQMTNLLHLVAAL